MHKMTLMPCCLGSLPAPRPWCSVSCVLCSVLCALCPCESNPRLRGEETGDMFRPPPNCPVSNCPPSSRHRSPRYVTRTSNPQHHICTSQPSPLGSRITNTEYRLSTSLPKSFKILILPNSLSDLKILSRPARLPFRHKDDVKFDGGILYFYLPKIFNFVTEIFALIESP